LEGFGWTVKESATVVHTIKVLNLKRGNHLREDQLKGQKNGF